MKNKKFLLIVPAIVALSFFPARLTSVPLAESAIYTVVSGDTNMSIINVILK